MPVHYPTGILAEHRAVREAAGLFDVSHMGEFEVRGRDALAFLRFVTTNDPSRLVTGQAQYGFLCRENGGIVDDLLVYRFADRFRLVVNAANIGKDLEWLRGRAGSYDVTVEDESEAIALLALQGPQAPAVLARRTDADLEGLRSYRFLEAAVAGAPAVVSRTGYTGEDGFELYVEAAQAVALWRELLRAGGPEGIAPAGLGARDTLRLEAGLPLYGNEIDETTTPLEANLGRFVKLEKEEFVGREALVKQKREGIRDRLFGFELLGKGVPRPGYEVRLRSVPRGTVRSGTLGPSVGKGIGTVYLPAETEPGAPVEVMIRENAIPGMVVRLPFYKEGSRR
jgi:aminomethyltransferase